MHLTLPATDGPMASAGHPAVESSALFREAAEAADVVERQRERIGGAIEHVGDELRRNPGSSLVTLARGSSDHAATYARYLIETRLGVLTSSAAPSVTSLYAAREHLRNTTVLAISQSGKSPDLLAATQAARQSGARVIALVNAEDSPLAALAHHTIPLCAEAESSVAATKSFIASLAAIALLVAHWSDDRDLQTGLERLPDDLRRAWARDWRDAVEQLRDKNSLYVVGRGIGLGVAQEAALKLKETCGMHAEAFSAAELRHGPMAIVRHGFPVLVFAQQDETLRGVEELMRELAAHGAEILSAGAATPHGLNLPAIAADPAMQPILHIQSFYRMVNALAIARGFDPDTPSHLSKITETL